MHTEWKLAGVIGVALGLYAICGTAVSLAIAQKTTGYEECQVAAINFRQSDQRWTLQPLSKSDEHYYAVDTAAVRELCAGFDVREGKDYVVGSTVAAKADQPDVKVAAHEKVEAAHRELRAPIM